MYILNVLMLGNYGKILKIGLEYYTTLTLKFQILIKVFGEKYNSRLKRIIVISIKDVIYQKRKKGDQLCLSDVKRAILKNLHIIRTQELVQNDRSTFDEKWKVSIVCLRTDPATKHSWYTI